MPSARILAWWFFEEEIQGGDALRESALNLAPFLVRNDSRQQIVRKDALRALVVAVHRESNALVKERKVGCLLALSQLFCRKFEQILEQSLIVFARSPGDANISSYAASNW
jgi:hypothetical protein